MKGGEVGEEGSVVMWLRKKVKVNQRLMYVHGMHVWIVSFSSFTFFFRASESRRVLFAGR